MKEILCKIFFGMIFSILFGLIIFVCVWSCIENEKDRITEGIIIDKSYSAAHITAMHYHPASYRFQLRGVKDERTVTYWLKVSKEDYQEYKVGNYYRQ